VGEQVAGVSKHVMLANEKKKRKKKSLTINPQYDNLTQKG